VTCSDKKSYADGTTVGPQHGITFESGIKGVWRQGKLSQNCGPRAEVAMWPYAVLDLRAAYQFSPNWQFAVSVNNIFDKRYYLSQNTPALAVWYGEPRNFMLRIDAKY
jgi:outer membrane receptor for ferric coprogen and ferric-rhodotorulic acid